MDEVRIGILGFGKMGRLRCETLEDIDACQVTSVFEPDPDIETPDGIKRVTAAERIIDDAGIDAVLVCTPNHFIKTYTIQCLRSGKDVFSEKPPGRSLAEALEMRDAANATGKRLMFGFNHRHHDSVLYAKQLVDSGQYGDVLWMRGRYGKSVPEDFFSDWRSKKEYAGGGIFLDQGIHMLDLFMMLLGPFEEIRAMVSNLYWHGDVEDNVFAIMRNQKGQVASLHSTMTQWRHLFSWEIFLDRGHIVINGLKTSSNTYGEETISIARNRSAPPAAVWTDEEHQTYSVDNSWARELGLFVDAVQNGSSITTCGADDAVDLMEMVDRVYAQQSP